MIQIRPGVFETDSSSSHAIIIAREGTKKLDEIDFRIGEFGWECDRYYYSANKASYFYTLACDIYGRDVADEISDLLSPYGIECTFSLPPVFGRYGYLDNGYVDHSENGKEFVQDLLSDSSLLIDFLFNDESYVETGNDNDDKPVGVDKPKCEYVEYYKGN